jgi:hypothetical protein
MEPGFTWVGVGVKGGGMLFPAGAEFTYGCLWSIPYGQKATIRLANVRLGLGLGGSGGGVLLMAFNCATPLALPMADGNDLSINLALGQNWTSILEGLQQARPLIKTLNTIRTHKKAIQIGASDIDKMRDLAHTVYAATEITFNPGKPKLVVIDLPFLGHGLELSASYSFGGKIILENYSL